MARQSEVFFITGEVSGDRHSAPVVSELLDRGIRVTGVGGPAMRAAGADLLADTTHWGAMGVPESLRRLPCLLWQERTLQGILRDRTPSLVVLVDFGVFNTRMARFLSRTRLARSLYYFPPGSWRQEPRDWSALASITDCIATPFARNAEYLRASGANAHWVGHPVVDTLGPVTDRAALRKAVGAPSGEPLIGLLPGSRRAERRMLGPVMLEAARIIRDALPGAAFMLSGLPHTLASDRGLLAKAAGQLSVVRLERSADVLQASDLVLVAMGTATLEATAALTPMVSTYDGSRIAKLIAVHLLRQQQRFYAMPNLMAGRQVVPEVVPEQPADRVTPLRLATAALELLRAPGQVDAMRQDLRTVRQMLGQPGVAGRTADLIVGLLEQEAGAVV